MAQITSGIRGVLSHPAVYDAMQDMMGARRVRRELVTEFIRPAPGFRVLDIGCGTAEILPFLPASVEYWGYDISAPYIEAARQRFGARGTFFCKNLTQEDLRTLPKFDAVLAIGVLHHLNDEEAAGLVGLAREALAERGRLVTIDPCFAQGQNPIARFLIAKDRGQNVRDAEGYCALARGSFEHVNGAIRHRAWIPYTHWIMECAL